MLLLLLTLTLGPGAGHLVVRCLWGREEERMRLLTHNIMTCNVGECQTEGKNYPLRIVAEEMEQKEREFSSLFITRMLARLDWSGILSAASDVRPPHQGPPHPLHYYHPPQHTTHNTLECGNYHLPHTCMRHPNTGQTIPKIHPSIHSTHSPSLSPHPPSHSPHLPTPCPSPPLLTMSTAWV